MQSRMLYDGWVQYIRLSPLFSIILLPCKGSQGWSGDDVKGVSYVKILGQSAKQQHPPVHLQDAGWCGDRKHFFHCISVPQLTRVGSYLLTMHLSTYLPTYLVIVVVVVVGRVPTLMGENHQFLFLLVRTELESNAILKTRTWTKTGTQFQYS